MKILKLFLQLSVTVVILMYLASSLPLEQVYITILASDLRLFAFSLLLITISLFFMSVRMNVIFNAQSVSINLGTVYRIRLISFYYKLFVPGGALANIGVLFYKFSQEKKNHKTKIISAILYDRILATMGLCLIGLFCLFISKPLLPPLFLYALASAFIFSLTLILIAWSRVFSKYAIRYLQKFDHTVPNKLVKFLQAINEFRNLSVLTHLYLFVLSLLPHIAGLFAFTLISLAMDLQISNVDWGWMRTVIIFGTMLPISLAGIGIRDGILIYLLLQFSIAPESAWAMSFLLLAATVIWPATLGLLFGKH